MGAGVTDSLRNTVALFLEALGWTTTSSALSPRTRHTRPRASLAVETVCVRAAQVTWMRPVFNRTAVPGPSGRWNAPQPGIIECRSRPALGCRQVDEARLRRSTRIQHSVGSPKVCLPRVRRRAWRPDSDRDARQAHGPGRHTRLWL